MKELILLDNWFGVSVGTGPKGGSQTKPGLIRMLTELFTDIPLGKKSFNIKENNREKLLDNIVGDIKTKYKNFSKPNFSFVSKIFDNAGHQRTGSP